MKVIHVLRKPCAEGTVAANVLRWGTGAINVDGCRIDSGGTHGSAESAGQGKGYKDTQKYGIYSKGIGGVVQPPHPGGRWPANLMLQHLDGCRQTGVRQVKGSAPASGPTLSGKSTSVSRGVFNGVDQTPCYTDPLTGTETVPAWDCAEGCPVAALDAQSGTKSPHHARNVPRLGKGGVYGADEGTQAPREWPGDTGGASRYFKQFTTPPMHTTSDNMNTDLADYLRALISPEERTLTTQEGGECVYLHVTAPDTFPWGEYGDASVHGLTVEAQSVEGQAKWLPEALRILKPGAHLLLTAPDDEPIGDTGACAAEDLGFEVRDCILWVDQRGDGDHLHYVAKAARAEREAGCAALPLRTVDFDADADDEEPGVGSASSTHRNFHPCVKPVGVMVSLLSNVPRDRGPVLEPFMGSGTTMMACVDTGHDGVGIERDPDYFIIAAARVRHRDASVAAWDAATIVSDHVQTTEAPEVTLEDLLGL